MVNKRELCWRALVRQLLLLAVERFAAFVSNMVVALESSRLSLSLLQRKEGMMNCVIPQGETGASDILPKADIPFSR